MPRLTRYCKVFLSLCLLAFVLQLAFPCIAHILLFLSKPVLRIEGAAVFLPCKGFFKALWLKPQFNFADLAKVNINFLHFTSPVLSVLWMLVFLSIIVTNYFMVFLRVGVNFYFGRLPLCLFLSFFTASSALPLTSFRWIGICFLLPNLRFLSTLSLLCFLFR